MATGTTDVIEQVRESSAALVQQAEALIPLLGETNQAARVGAAMAAGGFGPDGPFKYAPKDAVDQAIQGFKAEDDAVLGRRLADVADGVRMLERLMPAYEEGQQEAPTVLQAIRAKLGPIEAPAAVLTASLVDVMLESVLGPKVGRASVAEAAAWYRDALLDPLMPRNAATIRLIEDKVLRGTFAPTKDDPQAVDILADLARQVQQQRQARVPKELKVWRDAVAAGRRALILAQAANLKPAQSIEQRHLLELMKTLS
jgi:hypothetical protein